jgi:hypothetical protein
LGGAHLRGGLPMSIRRLAFGLVTAILLGAALAGCDTPGPMVAPFAGAPAGPVAFERFDGLPEGQFRKLVQNLSEEADTRHIAVASRAGSAQYRVKGYAAAEIRGKQTVIVWVWDVYDGNKQRVTRLGGEEQASNRQRGWSAADDQLLHRVAHEGIDQLATFLAAPPDRVPAPAPAPARSTDIASATSAMPAESVSLALAH